jgi:acetyl esterase/lipase
MKNIPLRHHICTLLLLILAQPDIATAQTNAPAAKPPPPVRKYDPLKFVAPFLLGDGGDPNSAVGKDEPIKALAWLDNVVIGKGGGRDLHAEVAYPVNAQRPMPAVILIHGGGWAYGGPQPIHNMVSFPGNFTARFAKQGYFTVFAEYRLSGEAKWPAQIQDCELAVRWLRANAAKYGVDPNRIGIWGYSAGGHLVACMATMSDVKEYQGDGGYPGVSSTVQAVVDWFGASDFTDPLVQADSGVAIQGLMGMPYAQNPEAWKKASPVFYVKPNDPPILIIHGEEDQFLPVSQAKTFDAALTKAGATHQLVIVKNGKHSFVPKVGNTTDPTGPEIQKLTDDFLAKYLKTP